MLKIIMHSLYSCSTSLCPFQFFFLRSCCTSCLYPSPSSYRVFWGIWGPPFILFISVFAPSKLCNIYPHAPYSRLTPVLHASKICIHAPLVYSVFMLHNNNALLGALWLFKLCALSCFAIILHSIFQTYKYIPTPSLWLNICGVQSYSILYSKTAHMPILVLLLSMILGDELLLLSLSLWTALLCFIFIFILFFSIFVWKRWNPQAAVRDEEWVRRSATRYRVMWWEAVEKGGL